MPPQAVSRALRRLAGRTRRGVAERRVRTLAAALVSIATLVAAAAEAAAAAPDFGWLPADRGQVLELKGMTFVASEGSANEIVLRSKRAHFYPDHDVADLEVVDVEVAPGSGRVGFVMSCEKGRLNLTSQDFVAEGNVVGTIEGGRRFEALWVAYDEEKGLLYTDDPVLITDEGGRYRGGGFRYFVHQQRFRLMGGASIIQDP